MADRPCRASRATAMAFVGVALVLLIGGGGPIGGGRPVAAVAGGPLAEQEADDGPQIPVNPEADPARAREAADEILRGDEYQAPEARDRNLLERVRRWIADRLPDIEGDGAATGTEVVSYVVLGVVVIAALAALTYVVAGARRRRRPDDDGDDVDAEVDLTPLRTPDEWEAEAERCEAAGDHRGAVRARFRSLTTALAKRGLVADTPGRTAGEMRQDVAERAPATSAAFGAAADLFERVWYGRRPADADDARAARDLGRSALAAAPRRAGGRDQDDDS